MLSQATSLKTYSGPENLASTTIIKRYSVRTIFRGQDFYIQKLNLELLHPTITKCCILSSSQQLRLAGFTSCL